MTFAGLESALNASAIAGFRNARLTWSGGGSAWVVYDARYADTQGMANARPQARILDTDLGTLAVGSAVTITQGSTATAYTVQAIEPDGAGLSTLILRRAS